MKLLLDRGVLHGDVLTCTGKTLAENLEGVQAPSADQDVIFPFDKPIAAAGQHLVVLKGNLAPNGCVIKLSGKQLGGDSGKFTGPARVYDSEDTAFEAVQAGKIVKGDVLVIRYEGPIGGPGASWPLHIILRHCFASPRRVALTRAFVCQTARDFGCGG
jgi:dihydroxy-acid dehydratase